MLFCLTVLLLFLLRVSSDTIHPAVLLGTFEELEQRWSEWRGTGEGKHVNIKLHLWSGSSNVTLSPQADVLPCKAGLPAALSRGLAQLERLSRAEGPFLPSLLWGHSGRRCGFPRSSRYQLRSPLTGSLQGWSKASTAPQHTETWQGLGKEE